MTQEFKVAVADHNLPIVRMMLSNELIGDPRGESFSEMLQYAKEALPDLFEAEEPSRFSIPADKEDWNEDVVSEMKRDLNMNFSVEKLALFVEMTQYVGKERAEELDAKEAEEAREEEERLKEDAKRRKIQAAQRKRNGTVLTASGAAVTITGLCIKGALGSVLSIAGGAALIGGVLLLTVPKNK